MKTLLICAKTGNADAFGEMYSVYAKELFLYALKYLGNREDAEDAVQQASLQVYKSIANVRSAESFKAYYFRAVANTARTMLKKNSIHTITLDNQNEIACEDNIENTVADEYSITKALETLDGQEKEIVLLSVVAGLNSKEIARITDLTAGSVRSKLSRSLSKLRCVMEPNERGQL